MVTPPSTNGRPGDQRVDVPAFADAQSSCLPVVRLEQALGQREVGRPGELEVVGIAAHEPRRMTQRLDRAGFVGDVVRRPCASAWRSRPRRNICGVCAVHLPRRSSVGGHAVRPHPPASACRPPAAPAGRRQRRRCRHRSGARSLRRCTRQRAASCTSTQSSPRTPRRCQARSRPAATRGGAASRRRSARPNRRTPAHAASKSRSSGASTTSVFAMRGTRAQRGQGVRHHRLARRSRGTAWARRRRRGRRRRRTARVHNTLRCRRSEADGHWARF